MTAADSVREVLIVDDEPLARRSVARQVQACLPAARIREAEDGFAALEQVRELPPDIVFLDVEMPELSGLDVLRQLPSPRPKIVFVTAFEHFAVRAFEENACDYLVKPFTAAPFATAVDRVLAGLDADRKLALLESSLAANGHGAERFAFRQGTGFDVVVPGDIVCLLSKEHYTYIYANGREYLTELSLSHFEERLDRARFARTHRSALVNVGRVSRVIDDPSSLVMDNTMEVPLSRRNRASLRRLLGHAPESEDSKTQT